VSQGSNQMARHFGHQRYRPLRIRFRTSTGDQPHSRHGVATTAGSSISSSSDLPGQEEEPSRPRTLTPLTRQVSRSRALRVAVQVAAVTERGGGACQMSLRGLSCDSATSGTRRLAQAGGCCLGTDASDGERHGSLTRRRCPSLLSSNLREHQRNSDNQRGRLGTSTLDALPECGTAALRRLVRASLREYHPMNFSLIGLQDCGRS
jgi:hypothetical protein